MNCPCARTDEKVDDFPYHKVPMFYKQRGNIIQHCKPDPQGHVKAQLVWRQKLRAVLEHWSIRGVEIPNHKSQIPNKSQ
jgi:hypothetical protein